MVYDWFNNNFTADFCSSDLNLHPLTIDNIPIHHKRACYNLDLLPATIYVVSEKPVSTLTTPFYSPKLLLLPSDYPNHHHSMKKYGTYRYRMKRGYCYRKYYGIRCYKKESFYCSTWSDKHKKIYYHHGFSRINSDTSTCLMENQRCMEQRFCLLLCLYPFYSLLLMLNPLCDCFITVPLIAPSSNTYVRSDWNFALVFVFTVWIHEITYLSS